MKHPVLVIHATASSVATMARFTLSFLQFTQLPRSAVAKFLDKTTIVKSG